LRYLSIDVKRQIISQYNIIKHAMNQFR